MCIKVDTKLIDSFETEISIPDAHRVVGVDNCFKDDVLFPHCNGEFNTRTKMAKIFSNIKLNKFTHINIYYISDKPDENVDDLHKVIIILNPGYDGAKVYTENGDIKVFDNDESAKSYYDRSILRYDYPFHEFVTIMDALSKGYVKLSIDEIKKL